MDKSIAIRQLKSSSAHKRLGAARYLLACATPDDLELIETAKREESVHWVRVALIKILENLGHGGKKAAPIDATDDPYITDTTAKEIYGKALEETTSLLLHEIEPIVGILRLSAEEEIPNFAESDTRKKIDYLESLLVTIATLRKAASPPKMEELELAGLIEEIIHREADRRNVDIECAGPTPLRVIGDKSLLIIAIGNGVRNSIEATEEIVADSRQAVIVNWGQTDIDYWVSIIDSGPGLASVDGAFDIGTTSKKGHRGMGLPAALFAASSLSGEVLIFPREGNGARFELRWPKHEIVVYENSSC